MAAAEASAVFTGELESLGPMRDLLREVCREAADAAPRRWMFQLELALNEAASNVIRHGLADRGHPLELRVGVNADNVRVCLLHEGPVFDPSDVPEPVADGTRCGGFGVFLIAQSVDRVRYGAHDDGRACVELVKLRPGPDALMADDL